MARAHFSSILKFVAWSCVGACVIGVLGTLQDTPVFAEAWVSMAVVGSIIIGIASPTRRSVLVNVLAAMLGFAVVPIAAILITSMWQPQSRSASDIGLLGGPGSAIMIMLLYSAAVFAPVMLVAMLTQWFISRSAKPAHVPVAGTMHCIHCGYSRIGQASPVCPECGRPWQNAQS